MPSQPEADAHPFFRPVASLAEEPRLPSDGPVRLVHCLNPFAAPPESEHDTAQRITLQAMENARRYADSVAADLEVSLHSACFREDVEKLDLSLFDSVTELKRSAVDFIEPQVPRHFPLLFDILSSGADQPGDFFLFTNTDIAPMPHFYVFVQDLLQRGFDAIIINRRTVSHAFKSPSDLPLSYSDIGRAHEGCDCFVLSRHLLETLPEHHSFIGISSVEMPLMMHMIASAAKPVYIYDGHVTLHIGDDKSWSNPKFDDYTSYNKAEFQRVIALIEAIPGNRERLEERLGNVPEGVKWRPGFSRYNPPDGQTPRFGRGHLLARTIRNRVRNALKALGGG